MSRTLLTLLAVLFSQVAMAQETAVPETSPIMAELAILAGAEAREVYNPLSCCDWGGSCVFPTVETAAEAGDDVPARTLVAGGASGTE